MGPQESSGRVGVRVGPETKFLLGFFRIFGKRADVAPTEIDRPHVFAYVCRPDPRESFRIVI